MIVIILLLLVPLVVLFVNNPARGLPPGVHPDPTELRSYAGMQMAIGALIALTTGACTILTNNDFRSFRRPDDLFLALLVGLPLPILGALVFLRGWARLRAAKRSERDLQND